MRRNAVVSSSLVLHPHCGIRMDGWIIWWRWWRRISTSGFVASTSIIWSISGHFVFFGISLTNWSNFDRFLVHFWSFSVISCHFWSIFHHFLVVFGHFRSFSVISLSFRVNFGSFLSIVDNFLVIFGQFWVQFWRRIFDFRLCCFHFHFFGQFSL